MNHLNFRTTFTQDAEYTAVQPLHFPHNHKSHWVSIPPPRNRKNSAICTHADQSLFSIFISHNRRVSPDPSPRLDSALCTRAVSRSLNHNSEPPSQFPKTARIPHFDHIQSIAISITIANPHLNSYQPQEFLTLHTIQSIALSITTASLLIPIFLYQPQELTAPCTQFSQSLYQSQQRVSPSQYIPIPTARIPHFAHMQSIALSITTASVSLSQSQVTASDQHFKAHMQSVALLITTASPHAPTDRKIPLSTHAASRSFNHHNSEPPAQLLPIASKFRTLQTCLQSVLYQSQQRVPIPTNRKNSALCAHAASRSFNHNSES